jgi:hypothetical protein
MAAIEKTPGIQGGAACLAGTRLPGQGRGAPASPSLPRARCHAADGADSDEHGHRADLYRIEVVDLKRQAATPVAGRSWWSSASARGEAAGDSFAL